MPVSAATITVGGECTLAEAIANANNDNNGNNNGCAAGSGDDTIILTGDVALTATPPTITSNITINGVKPDGGRYILSGSGTLLIATGTPDSANPPNYSPATLTIKDLTVTNNNNATATSAAVILRSRASLVIEDSAFTNIKSDDRGVAIKQSPTADDITITNSTFSNIGGNASSGQVGVAIWGRSSGNMTISGSTFSDNESKEPAGVLYVDGGMIVKITGSVFKDNRSGERGGAINSVEGATTVTVSNSKFENNTAPEGGAIHVGLGSLNIFRSFFSGNVASSQQGGAIATSGNLRLENSTFYNNRSALQGGAVAANTSLNTTIHIRHVTFVDNEAIGTTTTPSDGNAIYFQTNPSAHMYNSIIKGKSGVTGTECSGLDTNTNNIIYGETGGCSSSSTISDDPLLGGRTGDPAYYPIGANSPAVDAANDAYCTGSNGLNEAVDQRGARRPAGSACDIGAYEYQPPPPGSGGGSGGGGGHGSGGEDPAAIDRSVCAFCPELLAQGYRLKATYGLESGVQFRRVDQYAIGDQSLLAAGFLDAVDVYGYAEQGVGLCFPQAGRLLFLDAAFSPRAVMSPAAYSQDGMSCADFDRPGTLLLLPGPAPSAARALSHCMVTTEAILNFRESPGGPRLHFVDFRGAQIAGWLPQGVTLTALQRTPDWFLVDYHGTRGWVSAYYVTPHGTCG